MSGAHPAHARPADRRWAASRDCRSASSRCARALARRARRRRAPHRASSATVGPVDVWITHPRMVRTARRRVVATRALVVDGYESPFGSFLAHATALLPRIGDRAVTRLPRDGRRSSDGDRAADRVLCANAAQRISYLTILSMLGRIGPRTPDADVVLQRLVRARRPTAGAPARRARRTRPSPSGAAAATRGSTSRRISPRCRRSARRARRALPVRRHRRRRRRARAAARRAGSARSSPRRPTSRARAEFVRLAAVREPRRALRQADVGVCTYGDHLETCLSMRTRVIDMICGRPPARRLDGRRDEPRGRIEQASAGPCPPGDPAALADAASTLLRRSGGTTVRQRARHAPSRRARFRGTAQVAPLAAYCAAVAAGEYRAGRGPVRGRRDRPAERRTRARVRRCHPPDRLARRQRLAARADARPRAAHRTGAGVISERLRIGFDARVLAIPSVRGWTRYATNLSSGARRARTWSSSSSRAKSPAREHLDGVRAQVIRARAARETLWTRLGAAAAACAPKASTSSMPLADRGLPCWKPRPLVVTLHNSVRARPLAQSLPRRPSAASGTGSTSS